MHIQELKKSWDTLGTEDPLFAVLTYKDKRGGKWGEEEFFLTGKREVKETLEYLKNINATPVYGRALDFGCGVGRLTNALGEHFEEVHGVDIAPSMIKLAQSYPRRNEKCFYHVHEKDDLSLFPDTHFDFVFSKITLQHMEPRYAKNYIREFVRVLKPHGILLFQIPEEPLPSNQSRNLKSTLKKFIPEWLLDLYRALTRSTRPLIEMYGIPREEVTALLESSGARVVNIREDKSAEKWVSFEYCVRKS